MDFLCSRFGNLYGVPVWFHPQLWDGLMARKTEKGGRNVLFIISFICAKIRKFGCLAKFFEGILNRRTSIKAIFTASERISSPLEYFYGV